MRRRSFLGRVAAIAVTVVSAGQFKPREPDVRIPILTSEGIGAIVLSAEEARAFWRLDRDVRREYIRRIQEGGRVRT